MRIVSCVVLGFSVAIATAAHAAPPAGGFPARPFVRPQAGVIHVGPRANLRVNDGRKHFSTGFVGPYLAYPGAVGDEGARSAQSQVHAPHTNVWYGPRPLGQGDIGYVTHPAVYDVSQELARRPSFLTGPRK